MSISIKAYNNVWALIWERELNSNGKVLKEKGNVGTCPFLFQGQYYDEEVELAYNRFRYYDPEDGRYISQDPIGLLSGEFGFYNYVGIPMDGLMFLGWLILIWLVQLKLEENGFRYTIATHMMV